MGNHFLLTSTTLLLIILTVSPPTMVAAASENKYVLDVDGDPVEAGRPYFITASSGGGLTMAPRVSTGNLCPLFVGQLRNISEKGLPITFFSIDSSVKISEGMDVSIGFNVPTYCRSTGRWSIETESNYQDYVSTDGALTLKPTFKVESFRTIVPSYKLVYCSPIIVPLAPRYCAQLAPFIYEPQLGLSWLIPNNKYYVFIRFQFVKADKLDETSVNKLASVTFS